jgi:hypothetical protein
MQRKKLLQLLIEYCNKQGNKTFSIKELSNYYKDYSIIGIGGKTPEATVRRLLQELRFNNRKQNLYKILLKMFRKESLKLSRSI